MRYHWHLRSLMAQAGMFATTDLVPLLAERGVVLSREQVYRLVARVPERLSLTTLSALCDILSCGPSELIEPYRAKRGRADRAVPRRAPHRPGRPGPGCYPAPTTDPCRHPRVVARPAVPDGAARGAGEPGSSQRSPPPFQVCR